MRWRSPPSRREGIAAGGFGYNYWQYASTHQETDNATVAGKIHQVSSRIPGTVSQVSGMSA
ncbi:hypothetical protein [Nostoc flagelliforme]|uniref:hypothetical protein n=1 Tax=Nostoc flagelliforme TaxID=1306274 RepID=UPI0018EF7162|nr:hypothetical protein [Nostoc flagelliforme]